MTTFSFLGPFKKTVVDFWNLVQQENVQTIVMLTNLVENNKNMCFQYWPDVKGNTVLYEDTEVTLLDEEILLHTVVRSLKVKVFKIWFLSFLPHLVYILLLPNKFTNITR